MAKWEFRKVLNCIAYFALIFAAIALVLGRIFQNLQTFLMPIASFLAFCVASVLAFYYAKSKRSVVWMILFIISAIVVIAMLALSVFKI